MAPKVSFVISIYNAQKHLALFMKSIALQDFQDYELILVDADSQDGTRETLRKYAQQDQRIKLIEENFISIAAALNIGLKAALGEYIARVDADNFLYPHFLSSQLNFLEKNKNIDFVIADEIKINDDNKILGILPFMFTDYAMKKHLLFKTVIGGAPMLGRKKAFYDVGLYDEKTIITEDRLFALKAMKTKKFASIDTINYAYRIHAQAITHRYKKDAKHNQIVAEYEAKYIKPEDYINDLCNYSYLLQGDFYFKSLVLKKVANTILFCGLKLADLGRKIEAINEIKKSIEIYPRNKLFYKYFIWQVKKGGNNLQEIARKIDYWFPFNIDLMQLIPIRQVKKTVKKKEMVEKIMVEYNNLLVKLLS